jgi:hypothetical protein
MMTPPDVVGCRRLWLNVIQRAFADAMVKSRRPSATVLADRDAGRAWLLNFGRDFRYVCDLAGMDANYVRARAEAIAACGWQLPASALAELEASA